MWNEHLAAKPIVAGLYIWYLHCQPDLLLSVGPVDVHRVKEDHILLSTSTALSGALLQTQGCPPSSPVTNLKDRHRHGESSQALQKELFIILPRAAQTEQKLALQDRWLLDTWNSYWTNSHLNKRQCNSYAVVYSMRAISYCTHGYKATGSSPRLVSWVALKRPDQECWCGNAGI